MRLILAIRICSPATRQRPARAQIEEAPGIRVERREAWCLRLPRRSFQDEVDDRERSDHDGDDDDDPDADGSDHPTTLSTISPRLACAKP
jgi:hypothetical protein